MKNALKITVLILIIGLIFIDNIHVSVVFPIWDIIKVISTFIGLSWMVGGIYYYAKGHYGQKDFIRKIIVCPYIFLRHFIKKAWEF
jgi:hypothetical protein